MTIFTRKILEDKINNKEIEFQRQLGDDHKLRNMIEVSYV